MQTLQHQTRMTRQRAVILEELRKLTTHPTADELYQIVRAKMPRISLGTVYRNLCFLSDSGTILKLETPGNVKRFDGNVNPHQHIRCVSCGRVADVPGEVCLPDVQSMHVAGFSRVLSSRIEYDGICQACADCQPEENVCTPCDGHA